MNQLYRIIHMPKKRLLRKLLGKKEKYVIGIRKRKDDQIIFSNDLPFNVLFFDEDCWYADPIVLENEDGTVLFMEQYDLQNKKGIIACSYLNNNKFEKPVTIIENSFHMSFPFTFKWNNSYYMIPEVSESGCVFLYKALKYPLEWKIEKEFSIGKKIVDNVVIKIQHNKLIVVASEICENNELLVKFYKYSIQKNNEDYSLIPDENFNNKQRFNYKNRCAGRTLNIDDNMVLPTQESTRIDYGAYLNFRLLKKKSNNSDEKIMKITCADIKIKGLAGKELIGIHSYARTADYEIIDVRYME